MQNIIVEKIAQQSQLPKHKIRASIELLNDGATIPFIARYRKEHTGGLSETDIQLIQKEKQQLEELIKRKDTILGTIKEQGKLSPELEQKISNCWLLSTLEDIYLPYKPKRKTKASKARELGLEPLAKIIMAQKEQNVEQAAQRFASADLQVPEALSGARDIMAEWISEHERTRSIVRKAYQQSAIIKSKLVKAKEQEAAKYQDYFDWQEPLKRCPSHRLLAMRRGEQEGLLTVSIKANEEQSVDRIQQMYIKSSGPCAQQVKLAVADSYKRLLAPSMESEFAKQSKLRADQEAIGVFALNLRQLLLASPLGQKRVMAIDPGFRSGCKLVCLNEQGDLLCDTVIYPHPPQKQADKASKQLVDWLQQYKPQAIAIGNGTAGRETEQFIKTLGFDVPLFLISEDGASVYSASEIAREEFPDYDITVRGAVSIGRRLMDPLAELVKIDAKSIGVGQYQHDVNQKLLNDSLDQVVQLAVNKVGVNVNTASKQLLSYVSGLGPQLAQNIVDYRKENGAFTSRAELKKVKRMGAKAFEQSAAFLRIAAAKNPLDNSAVHPESYPIVRQMAKDLACTVAQLLCNEELLQKVSVDKYVTSTVGLPTLNDIMKELQKPGLDPREPLQAFAFADVYNIEDLQQGMVLPGIVSNLTKFGAFVNIGIKQDGLVHVSQMADKFVQDPSEIVSLGQQVKVRVEQVDVQRKRIQLSMRGV